jgi:hypothetical protein
MKNLTKLFGIIALMTIIGLTVACDIAVDGGDPIVPDEFRPIETEGRLIINGLSDYNGNVIAAHTKPGEFHTYLVALEQLSEGYLKGEYAGVSESTKATVIDGQAPLKIFKDNGIGSPYGNYSGNDQNVVFHVGIGPEDDIHAAYGTVTVNFTNGIGNGVFVLEIE